MPSTPGPFVSRAGEKLAHALDHFRIDPAGMTCADLGANVGGFTDCLLKRGAVRVYAVDTGYGALSWSLRRDPRVVVMERTNALHVVLPETVQLVTIDVGWTRQQHILPRAIQLTAPGGAIVSLIKPHYEADRKLLRGGVLPDELFQPTIDSVVARLRMLGIELSAKSESPLRGDAGNREMLALILRLH